MKIIFDCDNTFGVSGCDIDDGLALLYLLGKNAEILGITSTYGNSDIDTVYDNTKIMLKELDRNIPLFKGCEKAGIYDSEAVDFLVEKAIEFKGELVILATGSLTNIYGAYLKDNDFFQNIKEICLMGGITEDLVINGKIMKELNFSCDPEASYFVLKNAKNISIATGNNCLKAFFSHDGHENRLKNSDLKIAEYIYKKTNYWYEYMKRYDVKGFYNWDVVSAAYILDKSLFIDDYVEINPDIKSLSEGRLFGNGNNIKINLPKIKDNEIFEDSTYQTYFNINL